MSDKLRQAIAAAAAVNTGDKCDTGKPSSDPRLTNIRDTLARVGWEPARYTRRVAFMVHPPRPSELQIVRDTAREIQKGLHDSLKSGQQIYTRNFWFLDGCAHSSNWTTSVTNAADQTREAHCYQGSSQYVSAFDSLVSDMNTLRQTNPSEFIDGVIVIGNRFDEDARKLEAQIKSLADQGTKVFAFQTGPFSTEATKAFEMIANVSGGVAVQVKSIEDTRKYIPALVEAIMRPNEAHRQLPQLGPVGEKLLLGFQPPKKG